MMKSYLKLAPWRGLPPSPAGTLPERKFPLRFLQKQLIRISNCQLHARKVPRITHTDDLTIFLVMSTGQDFPELNRWAHCKKGLYKTISKSLHITYDWMHTDELCLFCRRKEKWFKLIALVFVWQWPRDICHK